MEKEFWDKRWEDQQTGWDIGYISTPLKEYFDQLTDKDLKILVPGAGNSYEAEYLHQQGFTNVYVIDISGLAIASFKSRCADFPADHAITGDFFELDQKFDLIVEQTFFCAVHPDMRAAYCKKMSELLSEKGKLVGLLFNVNFEGGPPFGGNSADYQPLFDACFSQVSIEKCYNSIGPRTDNEYWLKATN